MSQSDSIILPTFSEYIPWLCKHAIALSFFTLFAYSYCHGGKEKDRKDHHVFQRLRLLMMLMSFCDFLWPFRFYFTDYYIRITILSLAKLFDLLLCLTISTLSIRVFSAYYKAQRGNETIHCYEYTIVIIYIIEDSITLVARILQLSLGDKPYIRNFYMVNSIIWFITTATFAITLIVFLFRIIALFKHVHNFPIIDIEVPTRFSSAHSNGRKRKKVRKISDKAQIIYLKMIWLCIGIVLYYAIVLGVHLYFFIKWDIHMIETLFWIIITEILGHFVFFITLWSYLRVKVDDTEHKNTQRPHIEQVEQTHTRSFYNAFNNLCNSKSIFYGTISKTPNVTKPKLLLKTPQMISVDVYNSESASELSSTHGNTYNSISDTR